MAHRLMAVCLLAWMLSVPLEGEWFGAYRFFPWARWLPHDSQFVTKTQCEVARMRLIRWYAQRRDGLIRQGYTHPPGDRSTDDVACVERPT